MRGLRVLLVDDNREVLQTLRRILTRAGHNVITQTSVHGAYEIVGSHELDVVISDYWMADGTGVEVANELQRIQPSARLLLLTGDGSSSIDGDGFVVLHKPVHAHEILRAISNLLHA